MIVSALPRPSHAWRAIFLPLAVLLVWDIGVTVLYFNDRTHFDGIEIQFTLFGSAIALFIGFMVNAAYGRWWEARTLWGAIVNNSRSLARQSVTLVDDSARPGLVAEIVRAQIAYVHILRTALRNQPLPAEALTYLGGDTREAIAASANRQTAVLTAIDRTFTEAARRGMIGEIARVRLESTLVALTDAQGGLERIKNTPLPVQYRFLPRFFARAFCVILPFAVVQDLGVITPLGSGLIGLMFLLAVQIGDDLAEPFRDSVHDLPMTTICRTIEIDLLQMIGEPAPAAITPVDLVLW